MHLSLVGKATSRALTNLSSALWTNALTDGDVVRVEDASARKLTVPTDVDRGSLGADSSMTGAVLERLATRSAKRGRSENEI